jgi:anthranilate synthase component 1
MPAVDRIAVKVTATGLPPHDPLELYTRLREELTDREVFLFQCEEKAEPDRRYAVIGFDRLAEIRVFGDHLEIDGTEPVARALAGADGALGMSTTAQPRPGARTLRFSGSQQMWELLARAQALFALEGDVPSSSYAFGFLTSLAYETAWHIEKLPDHVKPQRGPDIVLTLFRDTVRYDLAAGRVQLLSAESDAFTRRPRLPDVAGMARRAAAALAHSPSPDVPGAPAPLSVHDTVSRETFLDWADRCLKHIAVGDVYQIQIGHRIEVRSTLTPVEVYRRLRSRNPSPYMYLLPRAAGTLIGASPELFFRIENGEIVMRPIAGTARRGPDEEENQRRIKEMQESTKERAEHIMLVDLCRNDIGRVSRPSTLPVAQLMTVERFSHVFHLVSTVTGQLEDGVDTWQAMRATFPAGTMTGAPKIRAMEIIDGLEEQPRGSYAGAVGLVDVRGWSEFALCIRTIEHDGTTYCAQSSAGMVAQSDPAAEWHETLAKMGAAYWALTGEELLP